MGIVARVAESAFRPEIGRRILDGLGEVAAGDVLEPQQIAVYDLFLRCVLIGLGFGGGGGWWGKGEEGAGDYEIGVRAAHWAGFASRPELVVAGKWGCC